MDDIETRIEAEIERLGAGCNGLGPRGSVCISSEGLKAGYVRYYDDDAAGYALASDVLSALEGLPDQICATQEGWESFWGSLPDVGALVATE